MANARRVVLYGARRRQKHHTLSLISLQVLGARQLLPLFNYLLVQCPSRDHGAFLWENRVSSLPNCLIASLILRLAVNCVITRGFKGNGGTYENLLVAKTLLESSSHGKSVGCDTKPRTRLLRPPPSPVPFVPNWTDKKGQWPFRSAGNKGNEN